MQIHLKRGEKLYVNGAVLKVDRRTTLEFLNDVNFLLENHVMQAEQATTPLRQLYFIVQSMLIDPPNAAVNIEVFKHLAHRLKTTCGQAELAQSVDTADGKIREGRYFDALKSLRQGFALEETGQESTASDVRAA